MIVTSIEQSKRLLEAGVSPKTTDIYAVFYPNMSAWHYEAKDDAEFEKTMREIANEGEYYECWSLSALWNIIHRLDKTYDFGTDMSAEELMEFLVNTIVYRFNNR